MMKESKSKNLRKIVKNQTSTGKQLTSKIKPKLIPIKTIGMMNPLIPGANSFRQQARFYTQKNSPEREGLNINSGTGGGIKHDKSNNNSNNNNHIQDLNSNIVNINSMNQNNNNYNNYTTHLHNNFIISNPTSINSSESTNEKKQFDQISTNKKYTKKFPGNNTIMKKNSNYLNYSNPVSNASNTTPDNSCLKKCCKNEEEEHQNEQSSNAVSIISANHSLINNNNNTYNITNQKYKKENNGNIISNEVNNNDEKKMYINPISKINVSPTEWHKCSNTAHNSTTNSKEKVNIKGIIKKNYGLNNFKDSKKNTKELLMKNNNNFINNININKLLFEQKKKFPQTSTNSRKNSGEKQISRIMSLKHKKLINPNNNINNANNPPISSNNCGKVPKMNKNIVNDNIINKAIMNNFVKNDDNDNNNNKDLNENDADDDINNNLNINNFNNSKKKNNNNSSNKQSDNLNFNYLKKSLNKNNEFIVDAKDLIKTKNKTTVNSKNNSYNNSNNNSSNNTNSNNNSAAEKYISNNSNSNENLNYNQKNNMINNINSNNNNNNNEMNEKDDFDQNNLGGGFKGGKIKPKNKLMLNKNNSNTNNNQIIFTQPNSSISPTTTSRQIPKNIIGQKLNKIGVNKINSLQQQLNNNNNINQNFNNNNSNINNNFCQNQNQKDSSINNSSNTNPNTNTNSKANTNNNSINNNNNSKQKYISNNIINNVNKNNIINSNTNSGSLEELHNPIKNTCFNKNTLINRKIMTATNSPHHSNQKNLGKSDKIYSKPNNREILVSCEGVEKFAKTKTKGMSNLTSTNNSRKNTSNKIKKINEKVINKNKIHNYINNNNNNLELQNGINHPHHNTLCSNASATNKNENNDIKDNMNNNDDNELDENNNNKEKKYKILSNIEMIDNEKNNNPNNNEITSNESSKKKIIENYKNKDFTKNNKNAINHKINNNHNLIDRKEIIIDKLNNLNLNNNNNNNENIYNKNQNKGGVGKFSKEKSAMISKQKEKIKLGKLTEKLIQEKLAKKKLFKGNLNQNINLNINNNEVLIKKNHNKHTDKEKIEQLLLKKEKLLVNQDYNNKHISKNKNHKYSANNNNNKNEKSNENNNNSNISDNSNQDNNNTIKSNVSKAAKKSSHNRNVEQNYIFNNGNGTNTSILSTMKDSNYYTHECENLSKYIKEYYQQNGKYPPTDLSFYKFGRMIGRGAFGKVNIGLNILTGRIVAIKSFNKMNIANEVSKKKILYETNLMRGLCHPSVTKILETFESEKYMLIIMEYISGGNLQSFVKKRRKLCEKTAKILFRQIIQGIKYIHSKGIVHRDIKLENILLDLNNIIKICDFGVGKLTKPGTILKDQCGTPVYMAPEIIKGDGYEGFPVDIWSAGVALYIMLSGNIPFNRDKNHDLQSAIINLPYKKIEDISEEANNLLKAILEKDPDKRFTAEQILEHPWMSNLNPDEDYDDEIKNVNKYHLFTNAEMILLAKTHIDYRNAAKKDLAENFTLRNLYTIDDKNNNKNVETKSVILAPYNSMLTDEEESEEEDDEDDGNKKKEKEKNKKNKIRDKESYYINSSNPFDILDNFNSELEIKNYYIKYHGKAKEFNMNYELNNNEEIDNGMLINSKNELVTEESDSENNIRVGMNNNNIVNNSIDSKYINENNNNKESNENNSNNSNNTKKTNSKIKKSNTNVNAKKHRPSSPYKPPPINKLFVKMVCELGYKEDYVIKCLEKNELNQATATYYLFSNYENVK